MYLDILYWASLFLGGAYFALTLALGGLSHLVSRVEHTFDIHHESAGGLEVGDHAAHGSDCVHLDHGHATDPGHVLHHDHIGTHADVDHGAGHHDAGDHGVDTHRGPGHGINLLAFLNPTMISCFLVGFGGAGVLSRLSGAGFLPSLACGGVSGSMLYYYAWWLIVRVFGGAQASSHVRRSDLVGVRAEVMAPIAGTRPGMIAYTVAGQRQTARAIAEAGEELPVGTSVRIRKLSRDTAEVVRIETGRS
ncbi:MAG: hypothetical protein HUU17_11630 [Chthonomonadales bacterium]|nr:hypothetical protein [Chthonomonadales bacterium]